MNKSIANIIKSFDYNALQVLWQTGHQEYQEYQEYRNESVKIVPFINDMANAYALSDLVVCRSGALTLSEVTVCGKPSILIPFSSAAGNHQLKNAKTLFDAGAAIILEERDLNARKLLMTITQLISNKKQLIKMSNASKILGKPNATKTIVDQIMDINLNV